eukprot:988872-Rhodomonas_salina.3
MLTAAMILCYASMLTAAMLLCYAPILTAAMLLCYAPILTAALLLPYAGLQRNFASVGYQQLRQQQRQDGDRRGGGGRRQSREEEEEVAMMPALPLLGLGGAGMSEFVKAFRDADLGEQPMVEVTVIAAKVEPGT